MIAEIPLERKCSIVNEGEKMRIRSILIVLLFCLISFSYAQETVQKKYCMSSIGYQGTSDELRAELLMEVKRLAVGEFFGEFISSYTKVEMFTLTEDRIVASSAGFVRIKGSPVFESGDSFGEVCVVIDAYVTQEDLNKFKPISIAKKHCVSDPNLTASQIKKHAKEQAIITALVDYDRKLESINKQDLLPLIHNIKYLESGFIPGTESYCVTFEGVIYPIEIIALGLKTERELKTDVSLDKGLIEKLEKKPETKYVSKAGQIFFKENFKIYNEWDPLPTWGENAVVRIGSDGRKYITALVPGISKVSQEINFPKNFSFEYDWENFCDRNIQGNAGLFVHFELIDDSGKILQIKSGCYGAYLPGLDGVDFREQPMNTFTLVTELL